MNAISTVVIACIGTLISVLGIYNYLPLDVLQFKQPQVFGSTVTTIAGTDTLSSSRTTINNNFSALNTGKFEISDWYATTSHSGITSLPSLVTIGTITTGSWNATAIPVSKGGTGTTSPSTYMVMLGNGSNGLTAASTTGTTGQFLTSNGAGAYPSWQTAAVDQAANYTWTGNHIFTRATTTNATTTNMYVSGSLTTINGGISTSTTFTATGAGTWTKPIGARKVFVQMWGAGGSGGQYNSGIGNPRAGGGGGGGYVERWYEASALSATESVSVGAGGAGVSGNPSTGNTGGNSTFSSSSNLLTAYGGAGGGTGDNTNATGGAGGSELGTGSPGSPISGAGGVGSASGGVGHLGAGGGGGQGADGGAAYYGGGGGGGSNGTTNGGTSVHGGAGGAGSGSGAGTAGSVPGGGGGGTNAAASSGAGGNGKIIVTSFI